jgi:cytidylate kinase
MAQVRVWKEGSEGLPVEAEIQLSEESALALERKAIEYAHAVGNIVIVGRGGQVVLKDCPDVLHVRIEAPLEDRLLRVRSSGLVANRPFIDSVETRRAAQDLIDASDAASAGYLRRFYNVDWADPMLYHLLINTGRMHLNQAVQVIIEAALQLDRVAA